jgi:hypothetical protein
MKRGELYWADLVPRSGSEQTPASRNRRVSRRIQPNTWMEIHYRVPDLDLVIAGQAWTDRHRTFGRDLWPAEDKLCRVSSGRHVGPREADKEARHSPR